LALTIPGLRDILFFFFISLLLFVTALAGVTIGTTTSGVAYMASVKSLIANLVIRLSCSCSFASPLYWRTDALPWDHQNGGPALQKYFSYRQSCYDCSLRGRPEAPRLPQALASEAWLEVRQPDMIRLSGRR
jgi:hypothetical protein